MINYTLHSGLDFEQSCSHYLSLGYTELNVSAPIGTRVFLNPMRNGIIRIGQDEGYDIFVTSINAGKLTLINVVTIYDHFKVDRPYGAMHTITEMELLHELDQSEIENLENWRLTIIGKFHQIAGLSDPFGLLSDFSTLNNFINTNKVLNLTHDYMLSKNIMKRGNQFIIIDPFA